MSTSTLLLDQPQPWQLEGISMTPDVGAAISPYLPDPIATKSVESLTLLDEPRTESTLFTNQNLLAGAAVFSSVASAYSAWQSGKTQKRLYAIQSKMAQLQAQAAQNKAEDILRAGNQQVASITYRAGIAKASARASIAASGVRAGTGSAAEIMASHDIVKEMQVNQAIANAVTQSYGAKWEGVSAQGKSLAYEAVSKGINTWAAALNSGVKGLYDGMGKGFLPNVLQSTNKNLVGEDSGLKG